ncbi:MAG TPA: SDR family oxidoreductase [Elusimicrobiota bacterium]|nr:SDR family oxidoreductase [Elusimicrobiota bacterium]
MATMVRAALVTGGARGIGKAIARRLVNDGMQVAMADWNVRDGRKAAAELGPRAIFIETDVGKEAHVRRAVRAAVRAFGRIDALVNNAGIANPHLPNLHVERWKWILGINLTGAFLCAKFCAPHLKRSRGSIVNIASTRALMSEPQTEAYAAAKGGLVALTHALAISFGPHIRVNCVSPGWIQTTDKPLRKIDHAQHPVGRVGRPEDVAALAAFLISPEAGFMTGQNYVIDGGMTRKMIYEP